jgi:hypothetical protein
MGISGSILDAIGFFLLMSVLFLPVVWFVGYFIWEAFRWKADDAARHYTLEDIKIPEEKDHFEEGRKAA